MRKLVILGLTIFSIVSGSQVQTVDASTTQNVLRFYNTKTRQHLITSNTYEIEKLKNQSDVWIYEGIAWKTAVSGTKTYRFRNKQQNYYFYTTNAREVELLKSRKTIWDYEGFAFYSGGQTPIYRAFNATQGKYLFSRSLLELYQLLSNQTGWVIEGKALFAVSPVINTDEKLEFINNEIVLYRNGEAVTEDTLFYDNNNTYVVYGGKLLLNRKGMSAPVLSDGKQYYVIDNKVQTQMNGVVALPTNDSVYVENGIIHQIEKFVADDNADKGTQIYVPSEENPGSTGVIRVGTKEVIRNEEELPVIVRKDTSMFINEEFNEEGKPKITETIKRYNVNPVNGQLENPQVIATNVIDNGVARIQTVGVLKRIGQSKPELIQEFLKLYNQERSKRGLSTVTIHQPFMDAAYDSAARISARKVQFNVFNHAGTMDTTATMVTDLQVDPDEYASKALRQLIASSAHRAIIMNPRATKVAIGVNVYYNERFDAEEAVFTVTPLDSNNEKLYAE